MALAGGWFHTGDQGDVNAAGNWRITGGIKNLIIFEFGAQCGAGTAGRSGGAETTRGGGSLSWLGISEVIWRRS